MAKKKRLTFGINIRLIRGAFWIVWISISNEKCFVWLFDRKIIDKIFTRRKK